MKGYGYSLNDPIRVSGFYAEKRYMESLCANGQDAPVRSERLGSGRSEVTGHPVDVYEARVKRGLFEKRVLLYVDIYGGTDWRAPAGFYLRAPAPIEGEGGDAQANAEALFTAIQKLQQI